MNNSNILLCLYKQVKNRKGKTGMKWVERYLIADQYEVLFSTHPHLREGELKCSCVQNPCDTQILECFQKHLE